MVGGTPVVVTGDAQSVQNRAADLPCIERQRERGVVTDFNGPDIMEDN